MWYVYRQQGDRPCYDKRNNPIQQQLLATTQYGFLRGRSWLTNLLSVVNMVTEAMDEDWDINLYLLILSEAFEAVNQLMICAKFAALGIAEHLVIWIGTFLAVQTFQLCIGNALSNVALPTSIAPQRSNTSSPLFIITINDLSGEQQLFCSMLIDNTKVGGKTKLTYYRWKNGQLEMALFHTPQKANTNPLCRTFTWPCCSQTR